MHSLYRAFVLVTTFAVTGLFVHAESESPTAAHQQNQLVKVVKKSAKKHKKHKKKKAV